MKVYQTWREDVDCILMAQDGNRGQALVKNAVTEF